MLKISGNYCFLGNLRESKLPKAKDEAFISRRLKYRVSEENKEIIYISELLDKAKNEYNLCFKIFRN
jgi:hypothetical protein